MEFLNPQKILDKLRLKKDMTAADFGSGSGGWVLPLSEMLEEGKVFAIDILEEPLSALRAKAKTKNLSNIETIRADAEKGTPLNPASCDLVLMTNLLFQCENPALEPSAQYGAGIKAVLEEGKRALKPGGQLLVVDWIKDAPMGPKGSEVSPEEVKETAEGVGLKLESEFQAGSFHYGLIFEK